MTEDEKIRKVIAKYEHFFENTISDVGHTKKEVWFFYEYDEKYKCYKSFFRFETADELEQIIIGVIANELNILIKIIGENVHHEIEGNETEINDITESYYDFCIPELLKNIKVLNREFQKSAERLDVIFQSLSGVLREVGEQSCSENLFDI